MTGRIKCTDYNYLLGEGRGPEIVLAGHARRGEALDEAFEAGRDPGGGLGRSGGHLKVTSYYFCTKGFYFFFFFIFLRLTGSRVEVGCRKI